MPGDVTPDPALSRKMHFVRYELGTLTTVSPIFDRAACGIYILEFRDGDRYVGQSVDFRRRFTQHHHGGKHHEPWEDIVAFSFAELPEADLDAAEQLVIADQRRLGFPLRNRTWNLLFTGPSVLDGILPPEEQQHWACGNGNYDPQVIAAASLRTPGDTPKIFGHGGGKRPWAFSAEGAPYTVADAVVFDLAAFVENIPNATELEGTYWTLSDLPGTSGGRFATLNVGRIELLYIPRSTAPTEFLETHDLTPFTHINFLPETFLDPSGNELLSSVPRTAWSYCEEVGRATYGMTEFDHIIVPVGLLQDFLEHEFNSRALRQTIVDVMRKGPATHFARWHSPELARRAYAESASI